MKVLVYQLLKLWSFSCPVISSWGGSLKEIGGDGIEYFNPSDVDDISFKLEKILFSDETLKNKLSMGLKDLKNFHGKNVQRKLLMFIKIFKKK